MNEDNSFFLQNNNNKEYNAKIYMHKKFHISFNNTNRFLIFKIQGLYCHELILCKWVNLQKSRY